MILLMRRAVQSPLIPTECAMQARIVDDTRGLCAGAVCASAAGAIMSNATTAGSPGARIVGRTIPLDV